MSGKKGTAASTALTLTGGAPGVMAKLDAKIAALKHIEESVYKTSGQLDGFPTNIKEETKVENLIRAFSSVRSREIAYDEAAKELGIKTYPAFNINGGNTEDWKKDILLRRAIIEHKETLDKLTSFKEKMSKFLSEEDQQRMLVAEMNAFLATQ